MKPEENTLFKEKSLLILDELIYPNKLVKVIEKQINHPKFIGEFLGDSYVRVMVICDNDEKRLDENCEEIIHLFKKYVESINILIIDEEDTKIELRSIQKQILNGIPEKSFYNWFMRLVFNSRQITIPLNSAGEPKKGYGPSSRTISFKFDNGLISNYIFFSSDGSLFNEVTFNEFIKKTKLLVSNKINKKQTNKNKKRNPLDTKLRHEVFKRDNYKCKECGATKEEVTLHADHIILVSQGGTDELENLQTLCQDCNLAKSNKHWIGGDIDGISSS